MKLWMTAAALVLLAGCGGSSDAADSDDAIREAAQAYSDAYLTGDAAAAYALLSERCQARMSASEFGLIVKAAADEFGAPLTFKSFDVDMNGDQARVTYTYDVAAINQTDEPWADEGGWKNDDC